MKFVGRTARSACFRCQGGFTLLEVIVAGSILAVGIGSVLTVYSTALKAMALTKGYEEAGMTAQSLMAQTLFQDPDIPFQRSGKCLKPADGLWKITGEPDGQVPGVKKIKVEVTFRTGGTQRAVSLVTSQADMVLPENPDRK